MQNTRHRPASLLAPHATWVLPGLLIVLALAGEGCKGNMHSSDPRVRPIERLLDEHLPVGTPLERVTFFLSTRGYEPEPSTAPRTLVAIIHHVDTETLQPATARVTFHFDASDHMTSYDLAPALDISPHP